MKALVLTLAICARDHGIILFLNCNLEGSMFRIVFVYTVYVIYFVDSFLIYNYSRIFKMILDYKNKLLPKILTTIECQGRHDED